MYIYLFDHVIHLCPILYPWYIYLWTARCNITQTCSHDAERSTGLLMKSVFVGMCCDCMDLQLGLVGDGPEGIVCHQITAVLRAAHYWHFCITIRVMGLDGSEGEGSVQTAKGIFVFPKNTAMMLRLLYSPYRAWQVDIRELWETSTTDWRQMSPHCRTEPQ